MPGFVVLGLALRNLVVMMGRRTERAEPCHYLPYASNSRR
jgi:hypothetical protein